MHNIMIFNKFINKILCTFILLFYTLQTTYAFGNPTHERLTEAACNSTHMLNVFDPNEKNGIITRLLKSCNIPDAEETSWLMWGHFYDFNAERSDLTKDSALSRMYSHFQKAKSLWLNGNRFFAIDELGKSIHYMQDMCCMVHTWGRFNNYFNLTTHRAYENALDKVAVAYFHKISISPDVFNFKFNRGMPIIGVANLYVLKTLNRYDKTPPNASFLSFFDGLSTLRDVYVGSEKHRKEAMEAVPFEDFELAYQATCELIYLFFQEVGINL